MSLSDPNRREALEELLSDQCGHVAPALGDILGMLRREKLARARRRFLAAAAGILVLTSVTAVWPSLRASRSALAPGPAALDQRALPPTRAEKPFRIERVDDEGLLALLRGMPSALVQWPDGRRDLMLVVQTSPYE